MRANDLNWQKRRYNALGAYCDSKLDDLLFTFELQRRLTAAGSTVRSIAAHPGIAATARWWPDGADQQDDVPAEQRGARCPADVVRGHPGRARRAVRHRRTRA